MFLANFVYIVIQQQVGPLHSTTGAITRMITALLFLLLLLLSAPLSTTIQRTLAQTGTNNSNSNGSGTIQGITVSAVGASGAHTIKNANSTLTYQNPDFGIKLQYPSNWTKQEDNLFLHTIAAFQLIHQNIFDFTNTSLAEVDLRVYNAPQNETFTKLDIGQINTQGQAIIGHYKNATTTLGGLPALKIINYSFGDVSQKEMQVWTFIPSKHVLVELIYIAQPSKYSLYLPIVQRMIDSVELIH